MARQQDMTDAQYKATNKLGKQTVAGMQAQTPEQLKKLVVEASNTMKKVKDELDANPKYQQAKADKSNLEAGKRDVDGREKTRINYALEILQNYDKLSAEEKLAWEDTRAAQEAKLKKEAAKA